MTRIFYSIKVRIALVIVLVQAGLLLGVLGLTLPQSLQASRDQLSSQEQATVGLMAEVGRVSLLTEAFSEFDIYIQHLGQDPHVQLVLLADDSGKIVASDDEKQLGQALPELHADTASHWQFLQIENQAGLLGTLAVRFSDSRLNAVFDAVWYRGLVLGLGGMLVATFVGIGLGQVLSRRLERLTRAAGMMADGDLDVISGVTGKDELGLLGRAFDQMAVNIFKEFKRRLQVEKQLEYNAFHDELTRLPNRQSILMQLQHMLEHAKRKPDYMFAVLFLDLDYFKKVNDSFGHAAGDEMLVEVAERLRELFRSADSVARLGGDEFLLVLDELSDPMAAVHIADRIKETIGQKFNVRGYDCYISCSIGIAFNNQHYREAEDLIRDADTAMYRAKQGGRQGYAVFDQSMHKQVLESLQLENELRVALVEEQLVVHYQPVFSLENKCVCSFEALVRWNHPRLGLLYPLMFIPIAEESGQIEKLGEWVFRQACQQIQEINAKNPENSHCTVSVNVSPRQLFSRELVSRVQNIILETGIDPGSLCLEITESLLIENIDLAIETLNALKKIGVKLSMDDFGTGYSSLSNLHRLPFDILKIDKSFIHQMSLVTEREGIVPLVITLAKTLGLQVIAEGVETQEQLVALAELKCAYIQGFLLGRPVPIDEVTHSLEGSVASELEHAHRLFEGLLDSPKQVSY